MIFVLALGLCGQAQAQKRDPCPEAISALNTAPDDLSKVQADIDRFTLCVERAQLLKRLNDLALENEENLAGVNLGNPGFNLDSGLGSNLPEFDRDTILNPQKQQPEVQDYDDDEYAPPQQSAAPADNWAIQSIFGAGSELSAKIRKNNGELAQIKSGDVLEDGTRIVSITPVSVEISKGGDRRLLSWLD